MIFKCRDKKTECGKKTLIMGIVNLTPDSFSDGGSYTDTQAAVDHAMQLLADGADIIDLGAQSTRPGYTEVDEKEEWKRLKEVLKTLRARTDALISVDTYFPYVAEKALNSGADIINDVSGSVNNEMAELVKKSGAGWIIMHSGAGSVNEVKAFFEKAYDSACKLGVQSEQLCFDCGIGFGKSYEENLELIANADKYRLDGRPLLLGFSRKRVIGAASGEEEPQRRTFGNIAADTAAVFAGADILRLHDVKNEIKGIKTAEELKRVWIK